MDVKDRAMTNNPVSVAGHLRLRDFSKSLVTANEANLSSSRPTPAAIVLTQISTGSNAEKGQYEIEDPREKLLSLGSSHVERFEKRGERIDSSQVNSVPSLNRPNHRLLRTNEKTEDTSLMKTPCEYCEHVFTNEADLNDHIGRFHAGVKKFVCFVCHKRFKRKQSLENHVLMIHGGAGSGVTTVASGTSGGSVVTDSNEVGNYNGDSLQGRHTDLINAREQMMMLMMKRKLEFSAAAVASRANHEQQQPPENNGDARDS